jgi:hypothetical protein
MIIIGCDFHTRFQQIAMLDPTTGKIVERRLEHETGEAEKASSYSHAGDGSRTAWPRPASKASAGTTSATRPRPGYVTKAY